eukprot:7383944-Prymnesium_polylepis.1
MQPTEPQSPAAGRRVPIWAGAVNLIRRVPLKVVFDDVTYATSAHVQAALVTTFMLDAATAEHLMRHSRDSVSSVKPFNQDTLRRDAKALRQRI